MNTNPPFQGRGFGYGPMVQRVHEGSTSLAWATFALVVLLVLMFGAYLIATYAGRGRHRHHRRMFFGGPGGPRGFGGRPDALEVLRMRFASGQMSRDEFLQATGDLTATVEPPPPPPAAA